MWGRFFKIVILSILLTFLLTPGPAFAQGDQKPEENNPIPDTPAYVIKPNDLLEIVVWGEPSHCCVQLLCQIGGRAS